MLMALTEEQQMIRDTARQFAESELAPNAATLDEHEVREVLLANLKTLADRYTEMEAARLLLMQAAWNKEQGLDFGTSAAMAKVFASEKANDACYSALQMMGGAGYIREYPLERLAREVRITTIYEGTSEIQRVIIARDLLKNVL